MNLKLSRRAVLSPSALALIGALPGLSGCALRTGDGARGLTRSDKAESEACGARTRWADADAIVRAIRPAAIKAVEHTAQLTGDKSAPDGGFRAGLQAAIDIASAAGGGRVRVPAGTWLCAGPIRLKSGVELHLERGANVRFLPDPALYLPVVFTRWEGTECFNYSPFVYAREQSDVALTGEGTLDGQGAEHWLPWRARQREDQTRLRDMGRDGVPVDQRQFGPGHWLRPHFVQFVDCERVLVEGVTLRDSPFWCVHPVYCRDVTVRGVTIISRHLNSDGVDPDSCQRVLIEDCEFDVGDDGVALKAGRDQDGWRVGRMCEDIVVRRCLYSGDAGGGMAIGSEMSGGVRRVFVDGYRIPKASHALYFKANLDRGGFIEDVRIRNIDAGEVSALIIFTNAYHSYRGGDSPTRFQRVSIEDVRCLSAQIGLHIQGDPRAPVRDVCLRNVNVGQAQQPTQAREFDTVSLRDVRMNGVALDTLPARPEAEFLDFKR